MGLGAVWDRTIGHNVEDDQGEITDDRCSDDGSDDRRVSAGIGQRAIAESYASRNSAWAWTDFKIVDWTVTATPVERSVSDRLATPS